MSRFTVTADPINPVGHALIRVRDGGGAARVTRLRVQRPDWAESFLGPDGWQVAETTVAVLDAVTEAADQLVRVGPAACVHVESGGYIIGFPELGIEEPVYWPEIVPPHGGGTGYFSQNTPSARPPLLPPQPPPRLQPLPPPPPPPPEPPLTPVSGPRPTRLGLFGVLAALSLAGGGAAWYLTRPAAPSIAIQGTQPPQPPQPPPSPDLDRMSVAELAARNKPDELLDQARKRMAARPQESMLLLEVAGDDDHFGPALTMLARAYDPGLPRQGGIPPDPRQAAKYYRDAASKGDADGTAEREALHAALVQRRDAGDLTAKLIVQDFWP